MGLKPGVQILGVSGEGADIGVRPHQDRLAGLKPESLGKWSVACEFDAQQGLIADGGRPIRIARSRNENGEPRVTQASIDGLTGLFEVRQTIPGLHPGLAPVAARK